MDDAVLPAKGGCHGERRVRDIHARTVNGEGGGGGEMVAMAPDQKRENSWTKRSNAAPEAVNHGEHIASPPFIPIPRGGIRYIWTIVYSPVSTPEDPCPHRCYRPPGYEQLV